MGGWIFSQGPHYKPSHKSRIGINATLCLPFFSGIMMRRAQRSRPTIYEMASRPVKWRERSDPGDRTDAPGKPGLSLR